MQDNKNEVKNCDLTESLGIGIFVQGRVSRLCAWANCHVSPINSIVIETIESTDAGKEEKEAMP